MGNRFGALRIALGLDRQALEQRAAVSTQIHTATDGRDILQNSPDGWEHDQRWLWWTGPAGGDGSGGPYGNPPPGAGDPYGLTCLPAVTRCTSIICDTIGGLPWHVFKGYEQQKTPRWIWDPQLLRPDGRAVKLADGSEIVMPPPEPGTVLSAVEFWTQWLVAALWFGDGYVFAPNRDKETGQPAGHLYQLNPAAVTIESRTGEAWGGGEATGMGYWVNGVRLPEDMVMHLRGMPPYENGQALGVIDKHGADLGLAATVRTYAAGVYGTGVPAGYLKVSAPNITEQQATDLKARWMAQHGSSRRSIAVLNATTEFHPISVSPIDAQLDLARTWSLRDVALAFGVPPYMLGVPGDASTYANVESRMTELRTFTLLPWIRRIESTLDAQFPQGTELKIRTDATLRADTSTRFSAYETALRSGWLTVDEVRAMEDRPPLPDQVSTDPGDELPSLEPEPQPVPEPVQMEQPA